MGFFKHSHGTSLKVNQEDQTHPQKPLFLQKNLIMDEETLLKQEQRLFFKRWLKNPGRLGTLAPITKRLAKKAATCLPTSDHLKIVEIGAGSGRLTRALLKHGIPAKNLTLIELDTELSRFLKNSLPHVSVIEGDARHLETLLPKDWVGEVDYVFSTIPFMCLDESMRNDIVEATFKVLKKEGSMLHLTYHFKSPMKHWDDMRLEQTRILSLWANLPPAFVWCYKKKHAT